MPRLLLLCPLLTLTALPLAAQLPKVSEAEEIEIGRQASAAILQKEPLLDNKELTAYLAQLGKTLAAATSRPAIPWAFQALNLDDVNAFALPGGFIYVHRGLIEAASTEEELAGALAHEVAHVAARHHAADLQRRMIGSLGATVLGSIFGSKGGMSGMVGKIGTELATSGAYMHFSRDAEKEADRIGARILNDAGYNPRGMVTLFQKLAEVQKSQPNVVQQFFSSHPSPEERAANINDLLPTLAKHDYRTASEEFPKMREMIAALPRYAAPPPPQPPADALGPFDVAGQYGGEDRDRQIAAALSPVFYQGLGTEPRYDWISYFSFDGDWRGDNNWDNAANLNYAIKAWIYYAVHETDTHFFAHYGVYHPRDYKGGTQRGATLSEMIREGVKIGSAYDPTGRAQEAVLAHENDMEGALVVAEKNGPDPDKARVVFVETLAHNKFNQYRPAENGNGSLTVELEDGHPKLFIEPKGHGIYAWTGASVQIKDCVNKVLEYRFADGGDEPKPKDTKATYGLIPLYSTLWKIAHDPNNDTYGQTHDYGFITIKLRTAPDQVKKQAIVLGKAGSGYLAIRGGNALARPPWGWFDAEEKDRPLGEWFFQPAETVKRHFNLGDDFSTSYLHTRF
jgi:Zn-dependent protease with chaperone function